MPIAKAASKATSERRKEPEDHGNDHEKCVAFLVGKSKLIQLQGGQKSVRVASARREAIGAGFYPDTVNCVLRGGAFSAGPISQGNGADTYVLRLGREGVQDVLTKFSARPDEDTKQNQSIILGIQRLLDDLAK